MEESNICAENIKNGDNIKHSISLKDIVNGFLQNIALDDINIVANYYTTDPLVTYTASKINGVYVNCVLDSNNNKLKFILENYNLDNGILYCNLQISVPDPDFPDGYNNFTKRICLKINLCDIKDIPIQYK